MAGGEHELSCNATSTPDFIVADVGTPHQFSLCVPWITHIEPPAGSCSKIQAATAAFGSMQASVVLVHSGTLQPLWQQPGLTQVGPAIQSALQHGELSVERILVAVDGIDPGRPGVLLHYSDPFVLRARPLR